MKRLFDFVGRARRTQSMEGKSAPSVNIPILIQARSGQFSHDSLVMNRCGKTNHN
jgi:hypothetical protein